MTSQRQRLTRKALADAGLRQTDLAKVIGCSQQHVNRMTADADAVNNTRAAPAAVLALVLAWPSLPQAVKQALIEQRHLQITE